MLQVLTLAVKDLRLLIRDRFGLFWVIAFPLIMALFFGSIFGGSGGGARTLKVAFVADSNPVSAAAFRKELAASEVLSVRDMPLDSARTLVAKGRLTAYILGIDPSRRAEKGYLNGLVNQAYFRCLQQQITDPQRMTAAIDRHREEIADAEDIAEDDRRNLLSLMDNFRTFMVSVDSVSDSQASEQYSPFAEPDIEFTDVTVASQYPRSSFEITFPQAIQWALIGCAAAFGISIVTERVRGTFFRLRLAPITRGHILAGKGLACFISCLAVSMLLMAIGVVIFGVRIASPHGMALALICSAFCFVGIMMFISVLGKTENAVAGAGWAILLVMSMTGGGMVPLIMLPKWMVTASSISPVRWSVLAVEGAVWRGFALADMLLPLAVLVSVGLLGFIFGTLILVRTDK
jgi:ABC-2 type transport system permease protein